VRPAGDGAESDDDDLGRQHEISADRRMHLGPLVLRRGRRMRTGCRLVQPWMCQLFHALEVEIGATQHQQRRHEPGREAQAAGFDQPAGADLELGGLELGFLLGESDFLLFMRAQTLGERSDHVMLSRMGSGNRQTGMV